MTKDMLQFLERVSTNCANIEEVQTRIKARQRINIDMLRVNFREYFECFRKVSEFPPKDEILPGEKPVKKDQLRVTFSVSLQC